VEQALTRKIRIVGFPPDSLLARMRETGFTLVDSDEDLIVAYGGDGTLIGAERDFPEVPKLGMRSDATCIKCPRHKDDVVLDRILNGEVREERLIKLLGTCGGHRMIAMNDIIFRNADPRSAVRFVVSLDGQQITEEMIGDGLVIATPFGSSAYFRSITRVVVRTGIGVAFNNCTDFLHHLVIGEGESLDVDITRGPATVTSDNDPRLHPVDGRQRLSVRRAPHDAHLVAADTLRCADCRYVHAPRRRY
jgi:NAD+ kinase